MNRSIAILTRQVCAFMVLCAVASGVHAQGPFGTVIDHNGTIDSYPSGTGDVDVFFDYRNLTGGPHRAFYRQMAIHRVQYTYAPGASTHFLATSFIFNETGVPWTGFRILLQGADFAGHNYKNPVQAAAPSPVVDVGFGTGGLPGLGPEWIALEHRPFSEFSLLGSTLTRFNDQGAGNLDAELIIDLGDPIDPTRAFALHYNIIPPAGDPASTGFTVSLTPIPEPATIGLLGLAAIVTLTRRRHAGV